MQLYASTKYGNERVETKGIQLYLKRIPIMYIWLIAALLDSNYVSVIINYEIVTRFRDQYSLTCVFY